MSDCAKLTLGDDTYDLPIIVGSENERAVDIRRLRADSGHVTLDSGYGNTGACFSEITFIDGDAGILRHHGIPIEQLAETTFADVCFLLLNSRLPSADELAAFEARLESEAALPEGVATLIASFPADAHPMCVLGSVAFAMSAFFDSASAASTPEEIDNAAIALLARLPTIAAASYRHSIGKSAIAPTAGTGYCADFLKMMHGSAPDADDVAALNKLLILHADHEQNCSASSVRLVGSSHADLFSSIAAGIGALWGPLHGGANQAVMEMLAEIVESGQDVQHFVDKAKDKSNNFRLMGFGHRVYKNYDPRARVIKGACTDVLTKGAARDPMLDVANRLEAAALADDYFAQRKLYPNVDFYSGLLYQAMGFPISMFTVLFAIGRLPGWIAQWKEMINEPGQRIGRPRQIYTGKNETAFTPLSER